MSDAAWLEASAEDAPKLGSPQRIGFTLNFAGLFAMLLGVGAFLWAQSIPSASMTRYVWREVAGAALAVALPLFLLGVVHATPGRKWARAVAYAGIAACVVGVAAFLYLYPYRWNVAARDLSPWGIVPYGGGAVLLGASAFMGLIDAYLDALRPGRADARDDEAPVTEEEVMRDIEEQTRRTRLTWGGVMMQDAPTIMLEPSDGGLIALNGGIGRRFTLMDQETSPEVDKLMAFRGAKDPVQEEMQDQAQYLVSLRAKRAEERNTSSAWSRFSGLFARR